MPRGLDPGWALLKGCRVTVGTHPYLRDPESKVGIRTSEDSQLDEVFGGESHEKQNH